MDLRLFAISIQASRLVKLGRGHEVISEHAVRVQAFDAEKDPEQEALALAERMQFSAGEGWFDLSVKLQEIDYDGIVELLQPDDEWWASQTRQSQQEEDFYRAPTVRVDQVDQQPGRRRQRREREESYNASVIRPVDSSRARRARKGK